MEYQPKTYYIKTLGCQANVADSSTMAGILEALGFEAAKQSKIYNNEKEELLDILPQTNLFILNTCSVRQKSEDKAYGVGKVFAELSRGGKKAPFAVMAGCLVGSVTGSRQRFKFEELQRKTPWVNLYMNPSQVPDLPNLLAKEGILDEWALQKFDPANAIPIQQEEKHAFVNISQGCDNFCTFCVVPYARGAEISRPKEHIIGEIKHLINRGYNHFTLCGQNVNSWGLSMSEKFDIRNGSSQKTPFADLLREINEMEGVEKIDFLSSNPFDFTEDLVKAFQLPKISNYLHIAVQSGNNDVLKRMNRRHTVEDFLNLTGKIKKAKPRVEFGTDVIVGFPGETREQFMDTVSLFQKVSFNVAYISMYSPRKGTPAEKYFGDDVPVEEKKWRHFYLTKVWNEEKQKAVRTIPVIASTMPTHEF